MRSLAPLIRSLREKLWLTLTLLVLAGMGIGLVSLLFAAADRRWELFAGYLSQPLLIVLNLLPPVVLCLFLYFLFHRAWLAYAVTAAVVYVLSLANWFKLTFRDDPVMFGDLFLVQEAGNMLGRYSLFVTTTMVLSALLLILGGVVLFFFARGRIRRMPLRLGLAALVLVLCLPLSRLYTSEDLYNDRTENPALLNRWAATQLYTSKGLLYPFLHSVASTVDTPPDGYRKEAVEAQLAAYTDADIPADKKVDVLGVMLEAFNDFSKFDQIQFAQDVYADFHALEAESYTGNLVTSIFAGGTVATERAFLTGMSDLGSLRGRTNSYAWYFADQGYTVTGSHPCYQWFYNRENVNRFLGFSSYLFSENHYAALAADGHIAMDDVFFPELIRLYDAHLEEDGSPYFSFSVTYQGHGPYATDTNQWGEDFVVPGVYTPESQNILNNYFGSVRSTTRQLSAFVDHFRASQRPVVLVIFGDHNPWLGDNSSVYKELGIDLDWSDKASFMNYYATRYLIWANDAAKRVLGNDFTGSGPDLSPNFLMNQVFALCGFTGDAYMQYTTHLMQSLPVRTSLGISYAAPGVTLSPEEQAALVQEDRWAEYYRRTQFQYGDLWDAR